MKLPKNEAALSFSAIVQFGDRQARRDQATLRPPRSRLPAHSTLLRAAVLLAARPDRAADLRVSTRDAGEAVWDRRPRVRGDVESLPFGRHRHRGAGARLSAGSQLAVGPGGQPPSGSEGGVLDPG